MQFVEVSVDVADIKEVPPEWDQVAALLTKYFEGGDLRVLRLCTNWDDLMGDDGTAFGVLTYDSDTDEYDAPLMSPCSYSSHFIWYTLQVSKMMAGLPKLRDGRFNNVRLV